MQTRSFTAAGTALLSLLFAGGVLAQQAENPVYIEVSLDAYFETADPLGGDMYVNITDQAGNNIAIHLDLNGAGSDSESATIKLYPNRTYSLNVGNYNGDGKITLGVSAPQARLFLDDLEDYELTYTGHVSDTIYVRLDVPLRWVPEGGLRAGDSSSLDPEKPIWYVDLGRTRYGESAGYVGFRKPDFTAADFFTPSVLIYENPDVSEISVVPNGGAIGQIYSREVLVDINSTANPTTYELLVYPRSAVNGFSGGQYTVTNVNDWFIRYEVSKITAANVVGVKITKQEDSETWMTSLEYNSSTSTWTHRGWRQNSASADTRLVTNKSGSPAVITRYGFEPGAGSATTGMTWKKTYATYAWGQELDTQTLGENEDTPLVTDLAYHTTTNSGTGELAGYLKSSVQPDGSWARYTYFGSSDILGAKGQVKRVFSPWLSGVSDPASATTANSVSEDWTYVGGLGGSPILPSSRYRYAPGGSNLLSKTSWTHSLNSATINSLTVAYQARNDFWGAGASDYVTSITKYYSSGTADKYFRDRPVSVEQPGGSKDAYVYFRNGKWHKDGDTDDDPYSFDAGEAGEDQMILVLHGQSTAGSSPWAGNTTSAWSKNGVSRGTDTVYLVPNRSTISETVIDTHGRVVLRAENVYLTGTSMARISGTFYRYDTHGRVIAEVDLIRSVGANEVKVERTYQGSLLATEKAVDGVVTKHEYDNLLRVSKKTVGFGGSSPYPAKVQTFAYHASGLLAEANSCDCSTDPIKYSYDDAGRIEVQEDPAPDGSGVPLETAHVYLDKRITKTTFPNGTYRTVESHVDGRPMSVTGDAQPEMLFDYNVDSNPLRTRRTTDPWTLGAWVKETRDLLGRVTQQTTPTYDWTASASADIDVISSYNAKGQLWRRQVQKTGNDLAPDTIYEYNPAGQRIREGVDLDNDSAGQLDNADRVAEYDSYFQSDTWGRYIVSTVAVAKNTSGPPYTQVSRAHTRVTGFNEGAQPATGQFVVGDSVTIDADGRTTTRWDYIEPGSRKRWSDTEQQDIATSAVDVSINGYLAERTSFSGAKAAYAYNDQGLLEHEYSRWSGSAYQVQVDTAYWDGTNQPKTVTHANGKVEYTYAWDATAKTRTVTAKTYQNTTLKSTVTTLHNGFDLPRYIWGDGTTPTEFVYDTLGRRTEMKTWRTGSYTSGTWPNGLSNLAATKWEYKDPGGLLWKKLYQGDTTGDPGVEYRYDLLGRVTRRTWDRGVSTDYEYHPSGELWKVEHSDTTETGADLEFTYTHLGQLQTVKEYLNGTQYTRTLDYNATYPLRLDYESMGAFYGSRRFTSLYETSGAPGRPYGFQLGTSSNADADLEQTVTYKTTGLIDTLTTKRNDGANPRTFTYGYDATSGLVNELLTGSGSTQFKLARQYETNRNAIQSVTATWGASPVTVTRFDYTYNEIGQRVTAQQSGSAFADYHDNNPASAVSVTRRFEYAPTGELTAAIDYLGTDTSTATGRPLPGRYFRYSYDNLGNRTSSNHAVNPSDDNVRNDYTPTALNQYGSRENNTLPVTGTANYDTKVGVLGGGTGGTAERQGSAWHHDLEVGNASAPWTGNVDVLVANAAGTQYNTVTRNGAKLPRKSQSFTYDDDGNLTGDGVWAYSWDAENRLKSMERVSPVNGDKRLEFAYDYLGRRVQKTVRVRSGGSWNFDSARRFVYDGWNLVAEFDAPSGTSIGTLKRSYTWGIDIASGSSTGGVGALTQVTDHVTGASYLPTYDGNGNVTALVDPTDGSIEATYEYTPFGEPLRADGAYADDNPFRFSTKFTDVETGLVYYGLRYYDPANGRFLNRDPIEEAGGVNLYGFVGNDPVNRSDILGLVWILEQDGYEEVTEYILRPTVDQRPDGGIVILDALEVRVYKRARWVWRHYPDESGLPGPLLEDPDNPHNVTEAPSAESAPNSTDEKAARCGKLMEKWGRYINATPETRFRRWEDATIAAIIALTKPYLSDWVEHANAVYLHSLHENPARTSYRFTPVHTDMRRGIVISDNEPVYRSQRNGGGQSWGRSYYDGGNIIVALHTHPWYDDDELNEIKLWQYFSDGQGSDLDMYQTPVHQFHGVMIDPEFATHHYDPSRDAARTKRFIGLPFPGAPTPEELRGIKECFGETKTDAISN